MTRHRSPAAGKGVPVADRPAATGRKAKPSAVGARGQAVGPPATANAASRRWPADVPEELAAQLCHQLARLVATAAPDDARDALRLVGAYLKHAQALAWRDVGRGDLQAPRRLLDSLLTLHPFLDAHLPDLDTPARAAVEIHGTLQAFYVATEALGEVRTEARLADRERSTAELAVLRVLAANTDRHLRRGQIHEMLDLEEEKKPTVARVGQILARLDDEGQLVRLFGTAQGNPETAFYALSGLGRETYRAIVSLHSPPAAESIAAGPERRSWENLLGELARLLANPDIPEGKRSIASGLLAHVPRSSEISAEQLTQILNRSGVAPADKKRISRTYQANLEGGGHKEIRNYNLEDRQYVWNIIRVLRGPSIERSKPRNLKPSRRASKLAGVEK